MNIQQLTEACHERGLYTPLLSIQYQSYIQMLMMKKRGHVITETEQQYIEGEVQRVLLAGLTVWLQWTEKIEHIPCILLSHAGLILSSAVPVVTTKSHKH